MGAQHLQRPVGVALGHESGEAALAGDLERVQAKNLTGGTDVFAYGDELLLDVDGKAGSFGDFIEHAGQAAAGDVAQAVDFDAGAEKLEDGFGESGGIAFNGALERQAFADGHDRHSVAAEVAVDQDGVAGLDALGRDFERVLDDAYPGGVDEEAVAFAFVHDLGVAGDDLHAGLLRCLLHRGDELPQGFHGQALLNDEARTEVEGSRAGHRKVVHRAVHSQGAEVATGKEQRAHDVGIGGEGEPLAGDVEHAGVVLGFEQRVAEGRDKELADELVHELAAAAVT
jgi:hypothetical protein